MSKPILISIPDICRSTFLCLIIVAIFNGAYKYIGYFGAIVSLVIFCIIIQVLAQLRSMEVE